MVGGCGFSGSADAQEKEDFVAEGMYGDPDGWVSWLYHPPAPDIEVECRREDESETYKVIPRKMSNVAGLYWRRPR